MSGKERRSKGIRVLGSVSSLALIACVAYIFFVGINLFSSLVLVSALGGLAGPAIASGDSIIECVSGFFELFIEGIQSFFEAIGEIISSIFD